VIFLADAGVERPVVEHLRKEGYTIYYVGEMQPGLSDDMVLDLSNQVGAVLLTLDKDFGELVFRQARITAGVVLIRLFGLSPLEKANVVADVIELHASEIAGSFTVITRSAVRIRSRFR
jgi:predicted nuclease of predicted toxin-antitoxin system